MCSVIGRSYGFHLCFERGNWFCAFPAQGGNLGIIFRYLFQERLERFFTGCKCGGSLRRIVYWLHRGFLLLESSIILLPLRIDDTLYSIYLCLDRLSFLEDFLYFFRCWKELGIVFPKVKNRLIANKSCLSYINIVVKLSATIWIASEICVVIWARRLRVQKRNNIRDTARYSFRWCRDVTNNRETPLPKRKERNPHTDKEEIPHLGGWALSDLFCGRMTFFHRKEKIF